jgi:hypothetical protein
MKFIASYELCRQYWFLYGLKYENLLLHYEHICMSLSVKGLSILTYLLTYYMEQSLS